MNRIRTTILLLPVAVLTAACSPDDEQATTDIETQTEPVAEIAADDAADNGGNGTADEATEPGTMATDDGGHDLADTKWQVETIGGEPVLEDHPPTLNFNAMNSLAGTSGCNRYTTTATADAGSLTIGMAAMTRMACPEPQSTQESRFTSALNRVARYKMNDDGRLVLQSGDGTVLMVAAPVTSGGGSSKR